MFRRIGTWFKSTGAEPWVYLVFLIFPLMTPIFPPDCSALRWWSTIGLIGCFLPLHFWSFRLDGKRRLVPVVGMALLGIVGMQFNAGTSTFFIYAAAVAGRAGSARLAWTVIIIMQVLLVAAFLLSPEPFPISWAVFLPALLVPAIGAMTVLAAERERRNARLLVAQQEVERLAVIAERERIGRDLHDLLGHTLTMISLKSELAAKLVPADAEQAAQEMSEVQAISRNALSQVRETVRGYRAKGLQGEMEGAKRSLQSANVAFDVNMDAVALGPREEGALALALREGVTNIVRHARATVARATIKREGADVILTLADNGRGGGTEGYGLAGIRERIIALGGQFERRATQGTTLTVRLPAAVPEP